MNVIDYQLLLWSWKVKMGPRKLPELSSTELSSVLSKAGLKVQGKHVNDKERFIRIATFLIDKGEDPVYVNFDTKSSEADQTPLDATIQKERVKLLEKILKLERTYFKKDKMRSNVSHGL